MDATPTTAGAPGVTLEVLVAADGVDASTLRAAARSAGVAVRVHENTADVTPDLVLLPLDAAVIGRHASCAPTAALVALADAPGADARMAAFRAGAAEVLRAPLAAEQLRPLLEKAAALRQLQQPAVDAGGHVIAVVAPKEGVGATTLVANIGLALAEQLPRQVACVDLDLRNGDLALLLNLDAPQSVADLAVGVASLDAVFVQGSLLHHDGGLALLAASTERRRAGSELGAPHVARILAELRASHRTVLVDAPPPLAEPTLAAALNADTVLVPTEPTVPCLRAAWRTLEALAGRGVPPHALEVVVTRFDPDDGSLGLDAIADALGRPVPHVIPREDETARRAVNGGLAVGEVRPDSPLQHAIAALAATLVPADHAQLALAGSAALDTL